MPELQLRLRLIDSVVISERAATVGEHHTLTRIPGALLLGACAANNQYQHARSFDLFHSGAVRFGDAFLEVDGSQALPMPLSLHRVKAGTTLYNMAEPPSPRPGAQLEQLRGGYLDPQQQRVSVKTEYAMRTAVDPNGRASDGLLFGYEAIAAGQTFLARIQADDDELIDLVRTRIVGKVVRLGKSRGAEHSRVEVSRAKIADWSVKTGSHAIIKIWCISDLVLRDEETGAQRLVPKGEDFGLAGYDLDPQRSFMRTRKWSPFNGKRKRPDLERQAIAAGSVLVFKGSPIDVVAVRAALQRGAGEYRAEGLGQVLVQPTVLDLPSFGSVERAHASASSRAAPLPADELGSWLSQRHQQSMARDESWKHAGAWIERMVKYDRVPTSQWGVVRSFAAQRRVTSDFAAFARDLKQHLERRTAQEKWKQSKNGRTAASELLDLVASPISPAVLLPAMEMMCTRLMRKQQTHQEAKHD